MTTIYFEPLTTQLGIAGTSFKLQIGLINERWAVNLLKGKKTIDTKIFDENDLVENFPNPDLIVNWALGAIPIPHISPFNIKRTVLFLMREAKINRDKKKIIAPIKEARKIKLEHVPNSEIKIHKISGRVVQDKPLDLVKGKRAGPYGLDNSTCISCGHQINYCPNCGTIFNKRD